MTAYYNEIDPYAAQWLRNLIDAGHIAPGIVDERSIEDVYPSDLKGFTQCHFFAGIGVWIHALRRAGWSDDRPVWTGSCPCQPFSSAGKGSGFADERHLWPAFHHLIKECQPAIVLGEQVASKDADPWIDLVHTDMEALGYAFGAIPFPSAGIGAPHIRDRLYWVANTDERIGRQGRANAGGRIAGGDAQSWAGSGRICVSSILGNAGNAGLEECQRIAGVPGGATGGIQGEASERAGFHAGRLADDNKDGCQSGAVAELHNAEHNAESFGSASWMADAKQHRSGCEAQPADHIKAQAHRPADQHSGHRVHLLPGPARLTASGQMLTGSCAGMESGGQLNPAHSITDCP